MNEQDSVLQWVDVRALRIGMFLELELDWLSHPFPSGRFKIASQQQIDTIVKIGLTRVRVNPSKSDAAPEDSGPAHQASVAQVVVQPQAAAPAQPAVGSEPADQAQRRTERERIAQEQHSLALCETRFADAARDYRQTIEQIPLRPEAAAERCHTAVNTMLCDMLGNGETIIRLLSGTGRENPSQHPVNVTVLSLLLGKALGMAQTDLFDLGVAAFLHDMGKVQLPERVRWPQENFTTSEYRSYQDHVAYGVHMGKKMGLSKPVLQAIAHHHELIDGSGFPSRVRGESMSVASRILALVNRYDNLCNPHQVASALTPHEALSLIFSQLKNRFDTAALNAFIRMMGVYPPGSVVQLVDDRFGFVVSVNSVRPLKPKLVVHESGVAREDAPILDLETATKIGIRRSVKPAVLPSAALEFLAPRARVSYFYERINDSQATQAA
jgi:putative nucleotidyltransferase with HDIG domain